MYRDVYELIDSIPAHPHWHVVEEDGTVIDVSVDMCGLIIEAKMRALRNKSGKAKLLYSIVVAKVVKLGP